MKKRFHGKIYSFMGMGQFYRQVKFYLSYDNDHNKMCLNVTHLIGREHSNIFIRFGLFISFR